MSSIEKWKTKWAAPVNPVDAWREKYKTSRPDDPEAMRERHPRTLPESTGIHAATDAVMQRLPAEKFPTAGRMFLDTVQGRTGKITEKDFKPEELQAMRELTKLSKNKGAVTYADYPTLGTKMQEQGELPMSLTPSLLSMGDALGTVQTTLGQFTYGRDSKGNLVIMDDYKFNPPKVPGQTQEARTGEYGALGPYAMIRDYAGEKVPPGYGRPVEINLGK